jgi:hypothetical protein
MTLQVADSTVKPTTLQRSLAEKRLVNHKNWFDLSSWNFFSVAAFFFQKHLVIWKTVRKFVHQFT